MDKYYTWFKRILISALILICCGYVGLFVIKNSTIVDIDLFFMQLQGVKLELAIVASFILGGVFGILASVPLLLSIRKKYRRTIKSQSKSLKAKTAE